MTLRQQLTALLAVVTLLVGGFVALSTWSFMETERFFRDELNSHLQLARGYERLVISWLAVAQPAQSPIGLAFQSTPIASAALQRLAGERRRLDTLLDGQPRLAQWTSIRSILASYTQRLASVMAMRDQMRRLNRDERMSRRDLSRELVTRANSLHLAFQTTIGELAKKFKTSDFAGTGDSTSRLLDRLHRVEGDLRAIQANIDQYVSAQDEIDTSALAVPQDELENQADSIEKRLRAVQNLLEQTARRAPVAYQKRGLQAILDNIQGFHSEFRRIRGLVETQDLSRIDLEERLAGSELNLRQLLDRGITSCVKEAEYFWDQIDNRVETLNIDLRRRTTLSQLCVGLAVILSVMGLVWLPRRLGSPLHRLSSTVARLMPGERLAFIPPSGVEEIDLLERSFRGMVERVGESLRDNMRYIAAIGEIWKVFATLNVSPDASDDDPRPDTTVGIERMLNLLLDNLPQLDVVKVVHPAQPAKDKTGGGVTELQVVAEATRAEWRESPAGREYLATAAENGLLPVDRTVSGWVFSNGATTWDAGNAAVGPSSYPTPLPACALSQPGAPERGLQGSYVALQLRPAITDYEITSRQAERIGNEIPSGYTLVAYATDTTFRLSMQEMTFLSIVGNQIIELQRIADLTGYNRFTRTQIDAAQVIQKSILPQRLPQVAGLWVDNAWRMASEVGGDCHDFFTGIGDGRLGLFIADVSGKNLPAALVTMTINASVRTLLKSTPVEQLSPGYILTQVNKVIMESLADDKFVTMICAIVDAREHSLTMALAGHPPAYRRFHDQGLKLGEMTASGPPLGILDFTYTDRKFIISEGDLILFYTDGVTECRNAAVQEFQIDRLKKFLEREHGACPAQELLAELDGFRGGAKEHDDITIIALGVGDRPGTGGKKAETGATGRAQLRRGNRR